MRRQRLELVAASFLMLFVELVAIRWSGAWIVHLSYFANFVLLGSFLGIGIGFLRAHKGPDLFAWSPVVIALFLGLVSVFPAQIDRTGGDIVFFGVRQTGLPAWVL
ncbi:MAG: spermidine synthase, partial [Actinomycetota bacterium]